MGNITSLLKIHDPNMIESVRKIELLLKNGMPFEWTKKDQDVLKLLMSTVSGQPIFTDGDRIVQELERSGDLNRVDDIVDLTPVMACAVLGRCDLGVKYIEKGAFLNIQTKYGLNALMIACILSDEHFVDMLLTNPTNINYTDVITPTLRPESNHSVESESSTALKQANINQVNIMGVTALLYAVIADSEEIVEKLIKNGASVNACKKDGITALHLAAMKGSEEMMQALLSAGCDCNAHTLDGLTPLMFSVQFNHTDTAEILLKSGAHVNDTNVVGNTALHIAAAAKQRESVMLLLKHGADCSQANKQGHTPLTLAASIGDEHIVDKLIKHQQNESQALVNFTDKEGYTALFHSSFQGHRHVVKLLLSAQGNPNLFGYNGWTPLMAACSKGHEKVVKILLEITPYPSNRSYLLALAFAVRNRHKNIVNIMLPKKEQTKRLLKIQETLPEEVKIYPLLHTAAQNGDSDIIKVLLRAGADINSCNQLSQTALLVAANAHHDKVVRCLIQHGANVNSCDVNGNTPLILASHAGCTSIVKILIEKKADLNLTNLVGRSALMGAANNGFHEIVEMLCNKNCSTDLKEVNGWTPLMLAAQRGFGRVVHILIERGALIENKTRHGVTAVMISVGNGRMNTTRLLLEKGANINETDTNGYTPLLHAASQGHSQLAEVLIERGADINIRDSILKQSPLSFSTLCGDRATTEMLIKAGADVNIVDIDGSSCVHYAAVGGYHHLVKILHENGASVDVVDNGQTTPLMLAAYMGHVKIVRYLINSGANYNLCCSTGWSPLMLCCQEGHVECIQELLDKDDINTDCREKFGHSALSISAANSRHNAVCLLLGAGANTDTRNQTEQTPLMLSTYTGNIEVVETLIESKASLDLKDSNGKTALIIATETNRRDIVKALLEAGADTNATTNDNMTALNVSVLNRNIQIVKLLLSYKARVDIADVKGNTPLLSSARTGNNNILYHLLRANSDITKQNKDGKTAIDICIEMNNQVAVQYLCQKGPVTESDKKKFIACATKRKCTEILTILNLARTDDSCQIAVQDTDNLVPPNDDDNDHFNDSADAVAESFKSVDVPSGCSAENSSTNTPPRRDIQGVKGLAQAAVRGKDTATITLDPTKKLNLQYANIKQLIVNNYSTNNIQNAQNVTIGNNSSIRCIDFTANMFGGCFSRACFPDTDDESDVKTHGYLTLKYTEEITTTPMTTYVTTCDSMEDIYLTPANSYQRPRASAPQDQHRRQDSNTSILQMCQPLLMSLQADDDDDTVPVLSEHQQGQVSILRVRIISAFVPVFCLSATSARDSMLSQYLVHRLAYDRGYLNMTGVASCEADVNSSAVTIANDIQSQASDLQTYYGYAQCVPAMFVCLFIGSYSDYMGRRFLLLVPLFTIFVKMVIITFIIRFHLDLRLMYLANGFDGLSGSWFALLMAIFALTADICTNDSDRSFWIFFASFSATSMQAILNIADGYLVSNYGFFEASTLLSCMLAVSFVVPLIFLPETHINRPVNKQFNPFVHMRRIFGFYFFDGSLRLRATYCLGILLFVIAVADVLYIASIDALYQMRQPFCWNAKQIGYYSSVSGAAAYVAGAVILKILQRCMTDKYIAMLGLLCQGAALTLEAFVWESWQFYLVPAIGTPGTPVIAIIRSLLSLQAGPDKQGALFSSIAVLEAAVGLAAAAAWYQIYSVTVSFMPGFVYLAMAACCFLTFALFIIYIRVQVKPERVQHVILTNPVEIQ